MINRAEAPTHDKTDARKIRSRDALYAAFLNLLEQKPLEQLSIREIAAAADVGHATFYRHYRSKEALLDDLAADEIRRVVDLSLEVMYIADNKAACLALCSYVYEHRTLWTTLLTGGATATVREELLRISREVAAETPATPKAQLPKELSVILTVTAMIETLSWWLNQDEPLPAEKVASYIDQIITSDAFV
ncbi:MAG: AcrR family transcriptional regulator [Halieaceae bacterium]|jgi:AcrR family transcriptional regulator